MAMLRGVVVRRAGTVVLDRVDLDIRAGAPTLLMGPNGAGKTSLLRLLLGLSPPDEGELRIAQPADGSLLRRAIVFQKPVMLKRTAAANIAFALRTAGRTASPDRVATLLDRVGLGRLGARPARRLSGGEQQRLALARALASEPDLLCLDEPTASLDPAQSKLVEDIIKAIIASGVKVVMATHDLGQARRIGGDAVLLVGGRVVEQAPTSQFFSTPATDMARRFIAGDLVI